MAKRRYRSKKRGRKTRRKSVYTIRRRRPKQPIQYFTRTVYLPNYYALLAGGPAVGAGLNFRLSQVPNSSEFTTLYDQYKIKAVKCTLIPRFTEVPIGSTQGNMWSVLDYDDSSPPGNLDELLQRQNLKRTRMHQIHSRYLRPMVTQEVYATGVATAYAPKRNVWLDCTNSDVEHYAVKFWFDARGTAPVTYDLQLKYYLAFKNVR